MVDKAQFNQLLGDAIKAARIKSELNQQDVGVLIGMSRVNIANIELGNNCTSIYNVLRLQQVLGFEIPQLDSKAKVKSKASEIVRNRKKVKIEKQLSILKQELASLKIK